MAGIDRLLAKKSKRGSRAIPHIGVRRRECSKAEASRIAAVA
jgi:hypothetical protein